MAVIVRIALALVLFASALAKARRVRASAKELDAYGIPGPLRVPATLGLIAIEMTLALAIAAGSDIAAYAAAVLLVLFAAAIGFAILRGRSGAPCSCFGVRSRIGAGALARNLVLVVAFAVVPSLPKGTPTTTGWLVLGLAASFSCIAALTVAVLALARELGVLRLRIGTESALDIADEGPPLGSRVPLSRGGTALTLAIFSSDGCRLCQTLKPVLAAFQRDPLVTLAEFDEVRDADVWRDLGIPGSPYAVALDSGGHVRAKGTFNSYGQLEGILATAERVLASA
ncbi:MAG: MauE/DoxX family redox-associated membrane protein [Actinomycetes bacterium]